MKWLAASVSHEVKNLLNPCGLHAQLLKLALKHDARATASVDAIISVLERGSELVQLLREISAQSAAETVAGADLNVAVLEAAEICRERAEQEAGVTVQTVLGETSSIRSTFQELRFVVAGLIAQAVDALPEGGGVTIVTGASDEGAWLRITQGNEVKVTFESIESFDAFVSDQRASKAGLQLAAAHAFARRCGGSLLLDATSPRATPVTLILPTA